MSNKQYPVPNQSTPGGSGGGSGTVTSVAMTGDGTVLNSTVTGSPVTTSGTLAPTLANAGANTVLGNATGSPAAPAYGQIVNGQITNSTIDLTAKVTNALPVANGGTGAATAGADTVFGNATGSTAAPGFTNAPVVSSISAIGSGGVSAGAVGTAGVVSLVGSTSGTATLTAPAVAGTAANPVTCTNVMAASGFAFTNGVLPASTPGIAGSGSANVNLYDWGGQQAIFYNSNQVLTMPNHLFHMRGGNLLFVTSNFTTAANTSLQTITGLTFVPTSANAYNWNFHCVLAYSIATGTAAVSFGIQAATNAPTNIFATGHMQVTAGPPSTYVDGVLATLTTTTATTIVSATPGATGTNYVAYLDGTLELPASANAINIMVSTGTSADAVTVLRGSYLMVF